MDTHTLTRDPGYTQKEDFLTPSHAAAAGGVTTIVDMPNVALPTDTVEAFLECLYSLILTDVDHGELSLTLGVPSPLREPGASTRRVAQKGKPANVRGDPR